MSWTWGIILILALLAIAWYFWGRFVYRQSRYLAKLSPKERRALHEIIRSLRTELRGEGRLDIYILGESVVFDEYRSIEIEVAFQRPNTDRIYQIDAARVWRTTLRTVEGLEHVYGRETSRLGHQYSVEVKFPNAAPIFMLPWERSNIRDIRIRRMTKEAIRIRFGPSGIIF